MVDLKDIVDPNFTEGLVAEIHLDYTREGMLGGRAHTAHVAAVAEVDHLNTMLTNIAAENFKLRRAAFNLCTSKYPSAHDDLWALCKDYDLTND